MVKTAFDVYAQLLAGFTSCGIKLIFVLFHEALGDRPRADVLLSPVGASGMNQEDLVATIAEAVDQQACTPLGHLDCILLLWEERWA
jgi:L-ascorbate metabolism protein UlaG (beta-lactamase superfamily)